MTSERTGETFEIGRVLSRAFGVLGRNFWRIFGLAVILSGLPQLASGLWRVAVQDPAHPLAAATIIAVVGGSLVVLIGSAILEVAITRATVSDLVGDPLGFAACLKTGIALALPMIGLALLASLGVCLALLLLIVPGLMLYMAWSVAVPAYVQERIGIVDSLGRSRALTKGARWKIFGLFLVYWIVSFPLGAAVGFLEAALPTPPYLAVVVISIMTAFGAMVLRTVLATTYIELRNVKEGVAPGELESIFA